MTNEIDGLSVATPEDEERERGPGAPHYQHPDSLLRELVNLINDASPAARIGVTLQIGGQVLSGDLCSVEEYLGEQVRLLEGLRTDGIPFSDELHRKYVKELAEVEADDERWPWPSHVHLLNAEVNGVPVGPWRGRLIAVTGWSFGTHDG